MTLPQVVAGFFIFKTGHESEEEENQKIIYFYPGGKSQDYQLSVVGLCEALLSFSNFFSTSCTLLHTLNGKRCFHQISDDIWAVMNVVLVNSAALPHGFETCESIIDDNIISRKLSLLCERFELIYGPMSLKSKDNLAHWREKAMEFFNRELVMLDLSFRDIPDIINGIQRKFCSPKSLLHLDNIGTKIQLTCQYPNTNIAIFYDAHLAWSSLAPNEFLPVLRFIVSDLLSLPPDLDLAAISPKAPHMGRFLTGPQNMEKDLCPPQGPVPLLYQRLPDSTFQRIYVVVYRALRLSVCLFIDAKHNLDKEFFQSFDSANGSALTDLSCTLDMDHNPNFGNRWNECLIKLEPETWLYFRRLNKREVFLIFGGKKVDISGIISESKRFGVENLAGLFRIF
nr:mitochondrial carrier triple repeat protein [Hymenolepis microstoma]